MKNDKIEEEVVLVYSGKSELSKNEIIFELKKHLPIYMVPTNIIFKLNMPMQSKNTNIIDKEVLKSDILQ